jgi:hypothetical protein
MGQHVVSGFSRTVIIAAFLFAGSSASAQVGKSLGVVDANTATEQVLVTAPNMTAPVARTRLASPRCPHQRRSDCSIPPMLRHAVTPKTHLTSQRRLAVAVHLALRML